MIIIMLKTKLKNKTDIFVFILLLEPVEGRYMRLAAL
jgi:hypothetical protein